MQKPCASLLHVGVFSTHRKQIEPSILIVISDEGQICLLNAGLVIVLEGQPVAVVGEVYYGVSKGHATASGYFENAAFGVSTVVARLSNLLRIFQGRRLY